MISLSLLPGNEHHTEKLIVAQLIVKFPDFMKTKGSFVCLRWSPIGPYHEPDESSPQLSSGPF